MSTETADLEKGSKLAAHFKKAAAHDERVGAAHDKMGKAHAGAQAHHEEMGKAEGADKAHHKAKVAFHKTMSSAHTQLHKTYTGNAEHLGKMAAACAEDDAKKVVEPVTEIQGEPMSDVTKTAPVVDAVVTPPAAAEPNQELAKLATAQAETNELLKKLLEKMTPVATPPPVAAEPVNEGVEAAKRAAELLTQAVGIRTFPVPRSGDMTKGAGISVDTVDPQFAHLVGVEHVE